MPDAIEKRLCDIEGRFAKIEADRLLLTWMSGFNLAATMADPGSGRNRRKVSHDAPIAPGPNPRAPVPFPNSGCSRISRRAQPLLRRSVSLFTAKP